MQACCDCTWVLALICLYKAYWQLHRGEERHWHHQEARSFAARRTRRLIVKPKRCASRDLLSTDTGSSDMAPSFVRVVSLLLATPPKENTVSFQVCLSPGCVADGAHKTLDKLQALAPPQVEISAGTCESLCGNGPVVSQCSKEKNKIIHRRISGDALLDLLSEYAIDANLLEGYDLVSQAQDLFQKKLYEESIPLYEKGIGMALEPATVLLESDDREEQDEMPQRLEWLVQAYREEAEARLQVNDKEGALDSARSACDLSNNADAQSLDVLATVCQALNDAAGELDALKAYFALPEDPNVSREVANRKRTLGFRLAKLEREAS